MNLLALITFMLVEVFFVAFIVLIARSGIRDRINRSFFYFLVVFALWGTSNYVSNITIFDSSVILWLNRLLFFVSILGLFTLLVFITRVTHQKPSGIATGVTIAMVLIGMGISLTPWAVTSAFVDQTSVVGVNFGLLALAYFFIVVYISGLIFYRLMRGVRQKSFRERAKARVLFVSIGVAIATILVSNVLLPVGWNIFGFTMVGLFAGMFIITGVSYGIVRHGMFDIKRAAVRSVTYSLVLITLALSYFVMAFLLSTLFGNVFVTAGQAINGVVISLILALIFQPVKHFFDQITNKVFYKDEYNSDDFFATLNRLLVSTTDLKRLLERISDNIAKTLKSEQVFFSLRTIEGRHITAGTEQYGKIPSLDARVLENYLFENPRIIQTSLLENNREIKRLLVTYKVELVMPLVQEDHIVGFLCLGDHLTSAYSNRDLRVLSTVSDELVIAIQNALSVQQVKDLNANLEQRIDSATKELRASNAQLQKLDEAKDEFISMASHQLRTPLTSIKGYISMLSEGDVGKVTPDQKHLLDEAFMSSERMVRLIGDFLNVSRLQTGKFIIEKHPTDLAKVVAEEIESLETNAAARGLKFTYKRPKNIPELDLDESKIRQVIMNFADNAMYYSKDNSSIKIELKKDKTGIEMVVKDSGIGVPDAEKEQLFNKFFRATNARKQRPDGTGVGLFLAKKVIDAHDGSIIFESEEGKGSTFGFRLPIKKLRV
ncbi:MAG: ATP-binding protein [Candidatus Microsaccharimonas sp.]